MKEPLAPYEMLCGLIVPLYVARVTEEVLYGRRGVTLQTSKEVPYPSMRLCSPPHTWQMLTRQTDHIQCSLSRQCRGEVARMRLV